MRDKLLEQVKHDEAQLHELLREALRKVAAR